MVDLLVLVLLASGAVFCGFVVSLGRNHVTAVVAYVFTFLCIGFAFVVIQESLIGIVHILVYSGAMAVVFLFVTFLVPGAGLVKSVSFGPILFAVLGCAGISCFVARPVMWDLPVGFSNVIFVDMYDYPYFTAILGLLFLVIIVSLGAVFAKSPFVQFDRKTYLLKVKTWRGGV